MLEGRNTYAIATYAQQANSADDQLIAAHEQYRATRVEIPEKQHTDLVERFNAALAGMATVPAANWFELSFKLAAIGHDRRNGLSEAGEVLLSSAIEDAARLVAASQVPE